jgi:heme-degrading monooxygenase HmoA
VITEHVQFTIHPGREEQFEAAFEQAKLIVAQAQGYHGLTLGRTVETPSIYQLLIHWDSVDDHMVGFRESDLYAQWAALLRPHYAEAPIVVHSEPISEG